MTTTPPSSVCPRCLEEAVESVPYAPAIHLDQDRPSDTEEETLQVTPYKKQVTRKRTYSYGAHGARTNNSLRSPFEPAHIRSIFDVNRPYEPRRLEFESHKPGATGSALLHPPGTLPRTNPSPPPSLGLLKLTGESVRPGDPLPLTSDEVTLLTDDDTQDVTEQTEEDSEQELETEVVKDVGRFWTPAGWWQQICLLLGLAVKFIAILGMSFQWMRMLWRLILFSTALAPAWFLIGRTYFTAKYIRRGVRYGLNARNYVDLYLPHRILTTASSSSSDTSGASTGGRSQLCAAHRASTEERALAKRKASIEKLSIVERMHLDALLQVLSDAAPGAGKGIDANALKELNDSIESQAVSSAIDSVVTHPQKAEEFAAEITANAVDPTPTPIQLHHKATTSPSFHPSVHHTPTRSSHPHVHMHHHTEHGGSSSVFPSPSSVSPPSIHPHLAPMVIFLTGGAWSIGYKAWGSLLGLGLSAHGVLVASVDYRNFPQGDVADMCRDVHTAIAWCFRHAEEYGGDTKRVFLVGQSAGAHLGSLAVLQNVEALLRGSRTAWTTKHLAGFVGISGCYDLVESVQHFHERGLPRWVFLKMMRSLADEEMVRYSPIQLVESSIFQQHPRAFQKLMPSFLIIHGKGDKTVSWKASHEFAMTLLKAKVQVKGRYYKNYSHTDPIIEGPLTGHDHLCHDLLYFIHEQSQRIDIGVANGAPSTVNTPAAGARSTGCNTGSYRIGASNVISPLTLATSTPTPPPALPAATVHPPPTLHSTGSHAQTNGLPPMHNDACVLRRSGSVSSSSSHGSISPPVTLPSPPSPSRSSRSLHSLFATMFAPYKWIGLPSFMLPGRPRRPSHLPHPFMNVDDVEEDEMEPVQAHRTSPILNTRESKWLRLWRGISHRFGWLVPASIHSASIAAARPVLRFLKPSPPPPEALESPEPQMQENTKDQHERVSGVPSSTSLQPFSKYAYPLQPAAQLPRSPPSPLIPRVLIRIARWINPF